MMNDRAIDRWGYLALIDANRSFVDVAIAGGCRVSGK